MTTATLLLILAAASSTIAYADTSPDKQPVVEVNPVEPETPRERRTTVLTPSGSNPASSAGASSYSGSSSGSSSGSGSGSGGGQPSNSSPQGSQGGSFSGSSQGYFPDYSNFGNNYPYYPFQNSFPAYNPYNFQQAYQQHMQFLQRLSQQHQAYVPNNFGPNLDSNGIDYTSNTGGGTGAYGSSGSFSGSGSGFGGGFGQPSGGFGQQFGGFGQQPAGGYGQQPAGGYGQPQFGGGNGQPQFGGGYGPPSSNDGLNVRLGAGSYGDPGDTVGASAVASISPQGGFGSTNLYPDLGTRVGGEFPAPSGQNFGVFTSSSSGSSDVNGVKKSFKTSTSGVNDNGKVTTYTAHDP